MAETNTGKLTALVADDMKTMRGISKAILNSMGISQVVEASNGMEALQKLKQGNIDLVICDWDMPQLCGIDVLKYTRKTALTAHVPFIMLTGNVKPGFVKLAVENGVSGYVTKPIQAAVLQQSIADVLQKSGTKVA